jgi:hypothetical protein
MAKPVWAENIDPEHLERVLREMGSHTQHLLWQLGWYVEHPHTAFDVTFYSREPILEVTLAKSFARNFCAAMMFDQGVPRMKQLLRGVTFSDGTIVDASEIWTLNFMPDNLDTTDVDLAQSEQVFGFGGEILREMIGSTYHCKSRAEEDWFLARWIAS